MKDRNIVYLIDDDEDDRFFIKEALYNQDKEVIIIEYSNGYDLLKQFETKQSPKASLILVDMNMPGLSGIETMTAIRSNPDSAETPAIMLSTSRDPMLANSAIEHGASNYFTKPGSFKGFTDLAKKLVNFYSNDYSLLLL
jgi:CheY-like chemotaxis protein